MAIGILIKRVTKHGEDAKVLLPHIIEPGSQRRMPGDKPVDDLRTLAAMDAGPASDRIRWKYGESSCSQNRV